MTSNWRGPALALMLPPGAWSSRVLTAPR